MTFSQWRGFSPLIAYHLSSSSLRVLEKLARQVRVRVNNILTYK